MEEFTDKLHKDQLLGVVAVDEAHCISSWDDAFRKEFGKLGSIRRRFGRGVPIVALTATASEDTEEEIVRELRLLSSRLTVVDARPRYNTTFEIVVKKSLPSAVKAVAADSADIFGKSRHDLANKLGCYHSNLSADEKETTVQNFMRGDILIVTCTLAMGMGVDFPGIRLVAHVNAPPSAERCLQEIWRAGRDGTPCRALLFRSTEDLGRLRDQIARAQASGKDRRLRALTVFSRWACDEVRRWVSSGRMKRRVVGRVNLQGGCFSMVLSPDIPTSLFFQLFESPPAVEGLHR